MARPPSSEIMRSGLAVPPLPELLVPGAKTSTARPPPGKDAETKSWPLLSNATAFVAVCFANPSIPVKKSPASENVSTPNWPPEEMAPFAKPMPSFELKAMATGPALWFVMTDVGTTFPFAL